MEWSKGLVCGGALMLGRRGFFGLLMGVGAGAVAGKLGAVKAVAPNLDKLDLEVMVDDYAIQQGLYLRMYSTTNGTTASVTTALQWSKDGGTWESRDNAAR